MIITSETPRDDVFLYGLDFLRARVKVECPKLLSAGYSDAIRCREFSACLFFSALVGVQLVCRSVSTGIGFQRDHSIIIR